jgi:hypothetical protein
MATKPTDIMKTAYDNAPTVEETSALNPETLEGLVRRARAERSAYLGDKLAQGIFASARLASRFVRIATAKLDEASRRPDRAFMDNARDIRDADRRVRLLQARHSI